MEDERPIGPASASLDLALAGAFVRGRLPSAAGLPDVEAVQAGLAAGLRLHRFKVTQGLARVRRVLGALRGLAPAGLLDVGSGRGAFLWPLLRAFPTLPVVAIDLAARRAADLQAMARGGVSNLAALRADVRALPFGDAAFDGVCALEVLEHLEAPAAAFRELVRVAARFVVASVPSREDENPEHRQRWSAPELTEQFLAAGARRVTCDHVLNHVVAVVQR